MIAICATFRTSLSFTASWFVALLLVLCAAECGDVRAGGLQASFRGVRDPCNLNLRIPETVGEWCSRVDGSNVLKEVGGHNLLTDRTEFDDWTESGTCAVTADQYRNPVDGTKDADLLDNTGGASTDLRYLYSASTSSNPHTGSIWVRVDTPHIVTIRLWEAGVGDVALSSVAATTQWRRISISGSGTGVGGIGLWLYPGERLVATGKAYFYGAQIVECNQSPCPMGDFVNPPDQSVSKPAHHLAATGTPSRAVSSFQGVDGNRVESRRLNGTTDFYSKAHHDSMNVNDGNHTYTFVLRQTSGVFDVFFSHGSFRADGFDIYSDGTQWITNYSKASDAVSPVNAAVAPDDYLYHTVQVVRNNDIATLYVDGVAGTPVDVSGYGIDGNRTLYLGAYEGGSDFFDGDIQYVRIDAKAASPDKLAHDREVLTSIVSNLTAVPREDVIVDGDMEDTGDPTLIWGVGNNAVLTKETGSPFSGAQVLRITRGGASTQPVAVQLIWTIGNTYRIVGRARGDGTNHPALYGSGGVGLYWTGISSTSWQHFDEILTVPYGTFYLMAVVAAAGYAEFDDVYVLEYSPSIASFARASTAMQTFSDGSMASVAANMPRVGDGLLVEGEGENLCLQSRTLNTTWTKVELTSISSDGMIAPDGTVSMDGLVGDADNEVHGVYQAVTVTAADHTFSVYAKPGDQDWLSLRNSTIANGVAYFDLVNCIVGTTQAGVTAGAKKSAHETCRCWITYTGTAAAHGHYIRTAEADNDGVFAGDTTTVNTWLWEAQVELGTFPTSPITTTTIPVTREPDLISWDPHPPNSTEVILSEEYGPTGNATKLTVYGEWKAEWSGASDIGITRRLISISDSTSANNDLRLHVNTSGKIVFYFRDDGGTLRYINSFAHTTYDEWFTVRVVVDFADFARSELWVNNVIDHEGDSNMTGTATWDTSDCLLRLGANRSGTVDGYHWTRELKINNREIQAP